MPALSTMAVIADPMRRQILRRVWLRESSVSALVDHFDVTQPAISFHLKLMRDSGHVHVRRDGRQRFYKANKPAFGALREYLESYWKDRLAQLKDQAELEARRRARGR